MSLPTLVPPLGTKDEPVGTSYARALLVSQALAAANHLHILLIVIERPGTLTRNLVNHTGIPTRSIGTIIRNLAKSGLVRSNHRSPTSYSKELTKHQRIRIERIEAPGKRTTALHHYPTPMAKAVLEFLMGPMGLHNARQRVFHNPISPGNEATATHPKLGAPPPLVPDAIDLRDSDHEDEPDEAPVQEQPAA